MLVERWGDSLIAAQQLLQKPLLTCRRFKTRWVPKDEETTPNNLCRDSCRYYSVKYLRPLATKIARFLPRRAALKGISAESISKFPFESTEIRRR